MPLDMFHDPVLSRAQSALLEALRRRGEPVDNLAADHPAMRALVSFGQVLERQQSLGLAQTAAAAGAGLPAVAAFGVAFNQQGAAVSAGELAEMAGEALVLFVLYVAARGADDAELAQRALDGLAYSVVDGVWLEAIAAYEEFAFGLTHPGQAIPYRRLQPGAGIVALPSATATLGIVGDWGTGTPAALNLLQQMAGGTPAPDVLIHLGDIYYAGTQSEAANNFLARVREVYPTAGQAGGFPVFTLAGNHDYYSGGFGYFGLVETLGQPASYFCLQSDDWQIVCLDTGYNDRVPWTVQSNITQLTDDQTAWLQALMTDPSNTRGTILLTHHQLYSGASPVGESGGTKWGINPQLYRQLSPYFDRIALWLWGHEHNTVIFQPQAGLPPGRCVGSGAVPMLLSQDPYATDTSLAGVEDASGTLIPVPTMNTGVKLGTDSEFGLEYNHGYATIQLNTKGAGTATVSYWQVDSPTSASTLYTEQLPLPAR